MPFAAPRPCLHPGCPKTSTDKPSYCEDHKADDRSRTRLYDSTRGTATNRGYDSKWQKLRRWVLMHHPMCADPFRVRCAEAATDVHHVKPRCLGGTDDEDNLQPLCKGCHSWMTRAGE
jgi:5-methylcytosine-specific restriction enzyme A